MNKPSQIPKYSENILLKTDANGKIINGSIEALTASY